MTKQQENQTHYRRFASWLSREIAKYGKTVGDYYDRQKGQFDRLVELETEFRALLQSTKKGRMVYVKFIRYIRDERRSILAARPYFRERQQLFTDVISDALKTRDAVLLHRFRFNFLFVQFALKAQRWPAGSKVIEIAAAIKKIRTEIVEMNMPLAISRARIFWGRTPKSHLALMDFVQIASVGLMSGIDKFVPPFAKVFRSVAIGRMTGNFIQEYSETPIHFFPTDKRKIYNGNKLVGKINRKNSGATDYVQLAAEINLGDTSGKYQTTPVEIAGLMAAASVVSADSIVTSDPDSPEPLVRFAAPESVRPDRQLEERDAMRTMAYAIEKLTVFERKLLRLRGLTF